MNWLVNKGMDILIRKEEKKDYNDIFDVNKLAFGQEEESRLVNKIRNGNNFIPDLSLVAEKDEKIIGHSWRSLYGTGAL